jgi:hypothetical protein
VSNVEGSALFPSSETSLSASRHAQRFDAGFEGGNQFVAVAGDHGDDHHPDRAKDQGVLGKVLPVLFADETFEQSEHGISFLK